MELNNTMLKVMHVLVNQFPLTTKKKYNNFRIIIAALPVTEYIVNANSLNMC